MSQKLQGTYSDVCCDRSACRRPTGPLFARSKQHAAPDKRVEVQLSLDEHTTRRERQEQARRVTNTDAHAQEGRVSARRLVFRQLVREQELSINNCTSGYLDLPLHEPGSTRHCAVVAHEAATAPCLEICDVPTGAAQSAGVVVHKSVPALSLSEGRMRSR